MFNIDNKDFKQLEKNLNNVGKYALIDTARATLSREAYETMVQYKKNVKQELTIRNPKNNIVTKSIGYDKADYKEHDIDKLESKTGQRSEMFGKKTEQLKKQEFGETLVSKTKYSPKATRLARGGNYKKIVDRDKLIAKLHTKRIGDVAKNPSRGSAETQFAQVVAVVHNTHQTIDFIPDSPSKRGKFGIIRFKDTGTYKNKKSGKKKIKGHSGKTLYSFEDKAQELHERPMLKPATEKTTGKTGAIFKEEAERRITKEMSKGLKK